MALPRRIYVREGQEGVYHCFNRCVRRAFLYGFDAVTGRDFSHRKAWLVDRLRELAAIFAIEVCAYAVLENHYHVILRTRPDIVANWSDVEVATRWLTLFPRHCGMTNEAVPPLEREICALTDCPERITELRKRLCNLSWFMARLNEFIARAANKEDDVKGRFWESRFKCQTLLDQAAIAACMVYVDLNPIRAGLAASPEESDFTSIQERILAWQNETMATFSVTRQAPQGIQSRSCRSDKQILKNAGGIGSPQRENISGTSNSLGEALLSSSWLCPIASDFQRRGILPMTLIEYFDLVDSSGRMTGSDKRGAINADLAPILSRIGANPDEWLDTVSRFGNKFSHAAGLLSSLRNFAQQLGRRWLKGVMTSRAAFAASLPQAAD
jgi:hypothetical protein